MLALGYAMAQQFRRDGGRWVYRCDQPGPTLPVSVAEHGSYVRWHGWMVLLGAALYVGGIVIDAMLYDAATRGQATGPGGGIALGVGALVLLYLFLRWTAHASARAFADRAPVAPALSRRKVMGKRTSRTSYTRIALVSLGLAAMSVVAMLDHPEGIWLAIALPVTIGAGFALWKWRVETGTEVGRLLGGRVGETSQRSHYPPACVRVHARGG